MLRKRDVRDTNFLVTEKERETERQRQTEREGRKRGEAGSILLSKKRIQTSRHLSFKDICV